MDSGKRETFTAVLMAVFGLASLQAAIENPAERWVGSFSALVFGYLFVWFWSPEFRARILKWPQEIAERRKRERDTRDLAQRVLQESKILVLPNGIQLQESFNKEPMLWDDIVAIEIVWEENPWGDPWFGSYNDTDWRITLSNSRKYRIQDSRVHRFVLEPLFVQHLPGYSMLPSNFDMTFSPTEGSRLCWSRGESLTPTRESET